MGFASSPLKSETHLQEALSLSLASASTGATLGGGIHVTASQGLASFSSLTLGGTSTGSVMNTGVSGPNLTVNLVLSSPGLGVAIGSPAVATLTIQNVTQPAPLVT